jgi:hypothetical protein
VLKRRGIEYVDVMILQICSDYAGLPDYRTLELDDIYFFYEGLRDSLLKLTKLTKYGS